MPLFSLYLNTEPVTQHASKKAVFCTIMTITSCAVNSIFDFLLFLASSYEFAVNINDSTLGQIELSPRAILTNISSLLVPAGESLQVKINVGK